MLCLHCYIYFWIFLVWLRTEPMWPNHVEPISPSWGNQHPNYHRYHGLQAVVLLVPGSQAPRLPATSAIARLRISSSCMPWNTAAATRRCDLRPKSGYIRLGAVSWVDQFLIETKAKQSENYGSIILPSNHRQGISDVTFQQILLTVEACDLAEWP